MRRNIIYIFIGLIVIVVAAGGYFYWKNSQGSPAPSQGGSQGTLPQTGTQSGTGNSGGNSSLPGSGLPVGTNGTPGLPTTGSVFGVVSNEPVQGYAVDPQNNVVIVEPNGEVARIANGQPTFLSSTPIQGLFSASLSYDAAKAVVSFGDPANPQTSIFDLGTKAWTPLPAGLISPVWSPSDYRLAYIRTNANGSMSLMTLDTSKITNKPVALFTANIQDVTLSWTKKGQITLATRPSLFSQDSIWVFDLQKSTFQEVAAAYGLESIWSNTTSTAQLTYSSKDYGGESALSFLGAGATSTQTMSFNTLPSKCLFRTETSTVPTASSTPVAAGTATSTNATSTKAGVSPKPVVITYLALYCAVPKNAASLTGNPEPDSYLEQSVFTSDAFYRVHTDSGLIESVLSPAQSVDASNLIIANNILFFINRFDKKLYAISITPSVAAPND